MKRRDFSSTCATLLAAGGLLPGAALAQRKPPEIGADYLPVDPRAPVDAPAGKIEVVEFFGYWCPHCNAFEPTFEAWRQRVAKDVVVRRVPVAFRDDHAPQQRLYYSLEAMSLTDKLHGKVFAAIHVDKKDLSKEGLIADWIAQQGVDKVKFMEQYRSFSVATKAARATQLHNSYRIDGVPALGVAGRFWTDGVMAKGMPRALEVVDFLVARLRAGK